MESTVAVPAGYSEQAPPADLANHVLCFWTTLTRSAETSDPDAVHRVLPDGCVDIVLAFGHAPDPRPGELTAAFGVGAMTKPLVLRGPGARLYVGVRFRPGFAFAAFGIPASELTDERIAYELLSQDGERDLAEVASRDTNEGRLEAVVDLVRRRLFGASPAAAVPKSVRAAVHRIVSSRGNLRIASIAADIGITRQQLAKQFATHVGVTPKLLARINRTQAALARADAARAAYPRNIDWSAIAYELGYYDQPHFIDDFKSLTGRTPGEWSR
jgi:AraC-like DNA-binding protein